MLKRLMAHIRTVRLGRKTAQLRWPWEIIGVLAAVAAYGIVVFWAPEIVIGSDLAKITTPAEKANAEHNARLQVVSVAGAFVVAVTLAFTARTYTLNRLGQVTDRFSKALERLGSPELYVRIGGVHALEHVMQDFPSHHADVVEVLNAFIRERTPRARRSQRRRQDTGWMHPPTPHEAPPAELPAEPPPDVAAALTVLGRRLVSKKRIERDPINLADLHLSAARLSKANLDGAILRRADLTGADLSLANLTRAHLRSANLPWAVLRGAALGGADLSFANLADVDLADANLTSAYLNGANMDDTNLAGADLNDATLTGVIGLRRLEHENPEEG